jgi:RNA polymerase-binding transcription factor DksA
VAGSKGRTCSLCGAKIPKGRLEALPDTAVCIGCSTEERRTDVEPDGPSGEDLRRSVEAPDKETQ